MQIDWNNRITAVLEYSRPVNQGRYLDHVLYDEYNTEGFSDNLMEPLHVGGALIARAGKWGSQVAKGIGKNMSTMTQTWGKHLRVLNWRHLM